LPYTTIFGLFGFVEREIKQNFFTKFSEGIFLSNIAEFNLFYKEIFGGY